MKNNYVLKKEVEENPKPQVNNKEKYKAKNGVKTDTTVRKTRGAYQKRDENFEKK